MENLSRSNLYSFILDSELSIEIMDKAKLGNLFNNSVILLADIEKYFLASEYPDSKVISNLNYDDFMMQLNENLIRLEDENAYLNNRIERSLLNELLDNLKNDMEKWRSKNYKTRNMFNGIIKLLTKYTDKYIREILNQEIDYLKEQAQSRQLNKEKYKMVFLSYAYDDYLYTIALFIYFKLNGLYLYIDWMHNDSLSNGVVLKESLDYALQEAGQLLYLRTINSELSISGSQYIRPWCSWETGNFYGSKSSKKPEKYFLNLYGRLPHDNKQLHGFALLTGISGMGLDGIYKW